MTSRTFNKDHEPEVPAVLREVDVVAVTIPKPVRVLTASQGLQSGRRGLEPAIRPAPCVFAKVGWTCCAGAALEQGAAGLHPKRPSTLIPLARPPQ